MTSPQPLTDDEIARMRADADETVARHGRTPGAVDVAAAAARRHATDVLRLASETERLRGAYALLEADLADASERNHELLQATDRLRHQRIVALGGDRGGDCAMCLTGRYSLVSASTELYQRPGDGTVVGITGVPVVECDVCGHTLVTMEVARDLERLRDLAERRPGDRQQVLWLDWADHARAHGRADEQP